MNPFDLVRPVSPGAGLDDAGALPDSITMQEARNLASGLERQGYPREAVESFLRQRGYPMPATGLLDTAGRAVERGVYNLTGSLATGAAKVADTQNFAGLSDWFMEAAQRQELTPEEQNTIGAEIPSFTDIRTDGVGNFAGDFATFATEQLFQSLPEMALPFGAGAAAKLRGAGKFGMAVAAGGASSASGFGQALQEQMDVLGPDSTIADTQMAPAIAGAVAYGALDQVLPTGIINKAFGTGPAAAARQEGLKGFMRDVITRGARAALQGVLVEGSTEVLQDFFIMAQADPKVVGAIGEGNIRELGHAAADLAEGRADDLAEAAVAGGTVGSILSVMGELFAGRAGRRARRGVDGEAPVSPETAAGPAETPAAPTPRALAETAAPGESGVEAAEPGAAGLDDLDLFGRPVEPDAETDAEPAAEPEAAEGVDPRQMALPFDAELTPDQERAARAAQEAGAAPRVGAAPAATSIDPVSAAAGLGTPAAAPAPEIVYDPETRTARVVEPGPRRTARDGAPVAAGLDGDPVARAAAEVEGYGETYFGTRDAEGRPIDATLGDIPSPYGAISEAADLDQRTGARQARDADRAAREREQEDAVRRRARVRATPADRVIYENLRQAEAERDAASAELDRVRAAGDEAAIAPAAQRLGEAQQRLSDLRRRVEQSVPQPGEGSPELEGDITGTGATYDVGPRQGPPEPTPDQRPMQGPPAGDAPVQGPPAPTDDQRPVQGPPAGDPPVQGPPAPTDDQRPVQGPPAPEPPVQGPPAPTDDQRPVQGPPAPTPDQRPVQGPPAGDPPVQGPPAPTDDQRPVQGPPAPTPDQRPVQGPPAGPEPAQEPAPEPVAEDDSPEWGVEIAALPGGAAAERARVQELLDRSTLTPRQARELTVRAGRLGAGNGVVHETGIATDENGKVESPLFRSGNKESVSFPSMYGFEGYEIHHNHPRDSSAPDIPLPFSSADLTILKNGAAVYAHADQGPSFYIRRAITPDVMSAQEWVKMIGAAETARVQGRAVMERRYAGALGVTSRLSTKQQALVWTTGQHAYAQALHELGYAYYETNLQDGQMAVEVERQYVDYIKEALTRGGFRGPAPADRLPEGSPRVPEARGRGTGGGAGVGPGSPGVGNGQAVDDADQGAVEPVDAALSGEEIVRVGDAIYANFPDTANTTTVRMIAEQALGRTIAKDSAAESSLQNALEHAVARRARDLIEVNPDAAIAPDRGVYDQLVALHNAVRRIGGRRMTNVVNQQYSTPAPMGYIVQATTQAGDGVSSIVEPTAGTGLLLTATDPASVKAYEIDPDRAASLEAQDIDVERGDYMSAASANEQGADLVLANPPFGQTVVEGTAQAWPMGLDRGTTSQIDLAIIGRALNQMTDDGRAAFILGGPAPQVLGDRAARKRHYSGGRPQRRVDFWREVYSQYDVERHVTVDGKLYQNQGAAWPVDIIIIRGRRPTPLGDVPPALAPWANPPQVVSTWADLYSHMTEPQHARRMDLDPEDGPEPVGGRDPGEREDGADPDEGGPRGGDDRPAGSRRPGGPRRSGPSGGGGTGGGVRPPSGGRDGGGAGGGTGGGAPAGGAGDAPAGGRRGGEGRDPGAEPGGAPNVADVGDGQGARSLDDTLGDMGDFLDSLEAPRFSGDLPPARTRKYLLEDATYQKAVGFLSQIYKAARAAGWAVDNALQLGGALRRYVAETLKWPRDRLRKFSAFVREFTNDVMAGLIDPETGRSTAPAPAQRTDGDGDPVFEDPYEPRSKTGFQVGTTVATGLRKPIADGLDAIQEQVGDIDAYVADKLGYSMDRLLGRDGRPGPFSQEQIDALASAIYNHEERGAAFVLGDQTGVGKGRVVAGMMRYARLNGMTPVFVTQGPALATQMYEDLDGIGELDNVRELTTAPSMKAISVDLGEGRIRTLKSMPENEYEAAFGKWKKRQVDNEPGSIIATGRLPEGYNAVFTTYDQMSDATNAISTEVPMPDTYPRKDSLLALVEAGNTFLILDESHLAAGDVVDANSTAGRAQFFRRLVAAANGVMFSSATFAKNPRAMQIYALRTSLSGLAATPEEMTNLMVNGGYPLQGIVSNMLAEAGQYTRRQRTFAGVDFNPAYDAQADEFAIDQLSGIMRGLYAADSLFIELREKYAEIAAEQLGWLTQKEDGSIGAVGAGGATFTSVMHNIIEQAVALMKIPATVDRALELAQHPDPKKRKKVVIGLARTSESLLKDFMKENDLGVGDPLGDADFREYTRRYLRKIKTVRVRNPADQKQFRDVEIPDDWITGENPSALSAWRQARQTIDDTPLTLPFSPIDALRDALAARGLRVDEITGRQSVVVDGTIQSRRADQTSKRRIMDAFNGRRAGEEIDVLILNRSGATGISLHADASFPDQTPRHMIVMEPEADIVNLVQLLGRIHRTGQVVLPSYDVMVSSAPAERKLASRVAAKMRSLNANTTASDKGATDLDGIDFLNKWGSIAAVDVLLDNPDLALEIGYQTASLREFQPTDSSFVNTLLGRIAGLLTVDDQRNLVDQIAAYYTKIIDGVRDVGGNVNEAPRIPANAVPIGEPHLLFSTPGGDSAANPFERSAYYQIFEIDRENEPKTRDEMAAEMERLAGFEPGGMQRAYEAGDATSLYREKEWQRRQYWRRRIEAAQRVGSEAERDAIAERDAENEAFRREREAAAPLPGQEAFGFTEPVKGFEGVARAASEQAAARLRPIIDAMMEKSTTFYDDRNAARERYNEASAAKTEADRVLEGLIAGRTPADVKRAERADPAFAQRMKDARQALADARRQQAAAKADAASSDAAYQVHTEALDGLRQAWDGMDGTSMRIGSPVSVIFRQNADDPGDATPGYIVGLAKTREAVPDERLSSWEYLVQSPYADKPIKVGLDKIARGRAVLQAASDAYVQSKFEEATTSREKRAIVIGNIPAGMQRLQGRGTVIQFNRMGSTEYEYGLRMARDFNLDQFLAAQPRDYGTGAQIVEVVDRVAQLPNRSDMGMVTDPARRVSLQRLGDGDFKLGFAARGTRPIMGDRAFLALFKETGIAEPVAPPRRSGQRGESAGPSTRTSNREGLARILDYLAENHGIRFGSSDPRVKQIIDEVHGTQQTAEAPRFRALPQPAFRHSERKATAQAVTSILARMTGGQVDVQLADELTAQPGEDASLRRSGGLPGQRLAGRYDPLKNLITVALNSLAGAEPTAVHEAWHWLRDPRRNFVGPADDAILKRAEPRLRAEFARRYGKEPAALLDAEEVEAYAIQHFYHERSNPAFKPVAVIFERVLDFFERTANLLAGRGYRSVNDVFRDALSGDMARADWRVQAPALGARPGADPRFAVQFAPSVLPAETAAITTEQGRAALARLKGEGRSKGAVIRRPEEQSFVGKVRGVLDRAREEGMARVRQEFVDRFEGMRRLTWKAIEAGHLTQENAKGYNDVWKKAHIVSTSTGPLMEKVIKLGNVVWSDAAMDFDIVVGEGAVDNGGLSAVLKPVVDAGLMDAFEHYLVWKRADRLRREKKEKWLTDEDFADFEAVSAGLAPDVRAMFDQAAERWVQFNWNFINGMVDAGLIQRGAADAMFGVTRGADLEPRFPDDLGDMVYVSFARMLDDDASFDFSEGGLARMRETALLNVRNGLHKLRGGDYALKNPVETTIRNMHSMLDRARRNATGVATLRVAQKLGLVEQTKHTFKGLLSKDYLETNRALLEDLGIPVTEMLQDENKRKAYAALVADAAPGGKDEVSVMVGGKPVWFRVHDLMLVESLKGLEPQQRGWFEKLFSAPKTLLTQAVAADPIFMMNSFVRDSQQAWVIAPDKFTPVVDSLRGAHKALTTDVERLSDIGSATLYDPTNIDRAIADMTGRTPKGRLATGRKLVNAWFDFGRRIELANRTAVHDAVYAQMIADGFDIQRAQEEALFQAMFMTNYASHGRNPVMRTLVSVVPYLNARVQGLDRLAMQMGGVKTPGLARKLALQMFTRGMLMAAAAVALEGMLWGDDDYEELEDWQKDTYLHFRGPDGNLYRFPKGFEIGVMFGTVPTRAIRAIRGDDSGDEFAGALWRAAVNTFNVNPIPQALLPAAEVAMNYSLFTERPIETQGMSRLSPEMRFRPTTSELMRSLAPYYAFTGLSPIQGEYLVRGYFGPIGAYALAMADGMVASAMDMPVAPRGALPSLGSAYADNTVRALDAVARRFQNSFTVQQPPRNTAFSTEFYELARDAQRAAADLRMALKEEDLDLAREIVAEKRELLALNRPLGRISRDISEIREIERRIRGSRDMTAQQKRDTLDQLQVIRNQLTQAAARAARPAAP